MLQNLVFNCIDLSLLFKHCHWNVRGVMFKPLHDFLQTVYETLSDITDDVAERQVIMGTPSSGLIAGVVAQTAMEIVNELTDRLTQLVEQFNDAIRTEQNPVTGNMLQDMTARLEKHLWMLRSQKAEVEYATKVALARAAVHLRG
jgi:starvation-inducible DNA-binding protein